MLVDISPFNNYVCITRINIDHSCLGFLFQIDSTIRVRRMHETVKIQNQKKLEKKKKISIWPLHTNFLFLYIAQHRSSI